MKKAWALVLVVLVVLAVWGAALAQADQRNFTIINDTGYPIKFIGINPPGDEVWNENELGEILPQGGSFPVVFGSLHKGCIWNIKVTWADDNRSDYFRKLNLCTINRVTLKYNIKTDTASYTTE